MQLRRDHKCEDDRTGIIELRFGASIGNTPGIKQGEQRTPHVGGGVLIAFPHPQQAAQIIRANINREAFVIDFYFGNIFAEISFEGLCCSS